MSATNETESPLERLNYINGQRLDASDFRLEQDYHMRMRRKLNRSLYSSGIADGLEVTPKSGDTHKLLVSPGLALDHEGREVILVEAQEVLVMGSPSDEDGHIPGNYLVIQYSEKEVAPMTAGCHVAADDESMTARNLSWTGQTRIRSGVLLKWRDTLPEEDSGQIVLAQVALDADCSVQYVETAVRQYIGVARAARASSYALEGEKDIDRLNPKRIYFHVKGRRPDSIRLYLRAAKFTTLFYSELPRHGHAFDVTMHPAGAADGHTHAQGSLGTSWEGQHAHTLIAHTGDWYPALGGSKRYDALSMAFRAGDPNGDREDREVWERHTNTNLHDKVGMNVSEEGGHTHNIAGHTDVAGALGNHVHHLNRSLDPTGAVGGVDTLTSQQLTYVNNLKVMINGDDATEKILNYLNAQSHGATWTKLGDGTDSHPLVIDGTGPIQLDFIPGILLKQDENMIELKVDGNSGGRILYNLYVE